MSACLLSETDTCRTACDRLYSADDDGCDIQRPGRTTEELTQGCRDSCFEAMQTGGQLDGYDPYTRAGATVSVELENKAQATLWAECIEDTSCEDLADGVCAPVW